MILYSDTFNLRFQINLIKHCKREKYIIAMVQKCVCLATNPNTVYRINCLSDSITTLNLATIIYLSYGGTSAVAIFCCSYYILGFMLHPGFAVWFFKSFLG